MNPMVLLRQDLTTASFEGEVGQETKMKKQAK